MSQDNSVAQQQQQQPQNGTPKHPSLDSQRRRPSSIAEQAMRKLGLGTHQRYANFSLQEFSSIFQSHLNYCFSFQKISFFLK